MAPGCSRLGHRRHGHADPDLLAIGAEVALVHLKIGNLASDQPRHLVVIRLEIIRVGEVHPGEPQQILALATRDGGEAGVDILNPPRQGIGEGNAQGRLVQDGA